MRVKSIPMIVMLLMLVSVVPAHADTGPISVLLLGDNGHHRPEVMAKLLAPIFAAAGIRVDFTKDVAAFNAANLAKFDVVAIYRDSGQLPPAEETALLDFVEAGKGLVAIHCASHCFRNSDRYTALVGGRFLRHETGVFRARIIDAQHPAMQGVQSFEEWDETYVHNQLADDIRVLMVRPDASGYEPYAWVRDQGKGRVFYTALGHDEHAWKNPGYQRLLEQGIRWAARHEKIADVKPFEYVPAKVPYYPPGKAWGTTSDPIPRMQAPLEPSESMKHMHLPEGFAVQLFAAEPDIARPIAMAWDARGRLWIAETFDYPNGRQPSGQGHDRIVICEDTKGTGRADKFTVFADHLSIPTSLVFADGGLIVAQMPDTLFLKATRGDDKADVRRILFSGWGTSDTHAGPSNFRRGFDNWIWGTVGYSGFDGTVGGKHHAFGQGIFRFKPDGSELEFLSSTTNNTWGLGMSQTGRVFASTANNQHSVHLAIPNRMFESVRGWYGQGSASIEDHKKFHPITQAVRQVDYHGGYTAACGQALYTAGTFPPDFTDRAAFVCEPTGHLVHLDWLIPHGSGYVARDGWNMLASDDEWTAPIMAEVGPDGALWVIDWYNYIVQHNPTPSGFETGKGGAYVTPLRDKTHGRIYRIVYKGAKAPERPHLDRATSAELLKALGNDNLWWRQTAQRLLVERGDNDVLPLLAARVRDDRIGLAATHALWTMHGLGAFQDSKWLELLSAALTHLNPGVRLAALGVLSRSAESVARILAAGSLTDDDAQVRLEALLALGEMPGSKAAAQQLVSMLREPRNASDRWIPLAATAAAARSDLDFLQAAATAPVAPETPETSASLTSAVQTVAAHFARGAPSDRVGVLLEAVTMAKPAVAEALLAGLAKGWPPGKLVALDRAVDLTALSAKLSPSSLLQFAGLMRRWGQQDKIQAVTAGLKGSLMSRAGDEKRSDAARLAAVRDLITLGCDQATENVVLQQISPRASPEFVRGILDTLGESASEKIGTAIVGRWRELTPLARSSALALLLRRPAWTRSLLKGLQQGQIDPSDLGIDHAQQLSQHPDATIAAQARTLLAGSGRLPEASRSKVLAALMPLAGRHGDRTRGHAVFEKNCSKCHRFGAIGQVVGPDLTGSAARSRADILVDVLDPNRSVEGNYRQFTIETKSGLFLTGVLAAETKTAVELVDSEAKKHVIFREDIETITSSKTSLMPEGFEKLGEADLASLLDFLTARDRFFPLPIGKAATITSVRGMFTDRDNEIERLVFPRWGPQTVFGVPFQVIDPRSGSIPNVILLYGPQGRVCREMPRSAIVPCNASAKRIHLLSGVSGWGWPFGERGSTSMIVRLHYADGETEDHRLLNGSHFADYIRVVDVPESKLAFRLRGQQLRYLAITPARADVIGSIEFVKGNDTSAPLVMAVTVEGRD
jgi:putative membrane-bound dehydrogenase-like protein